MLAVCCKISLLFGNTCYFLIACVDIAVHLYLGYGAISKYACTLFLLHGVCTVGVDFHDSLQ